MKKIAIIVAHDISRGIGKNGVLPGWKIPKDIKFFKDITSGGVTIMGFITWNSIPEKYRPLKGRLNIIISTTMENPPEGVILCRSLEEAIESAKGSELENIWIAGGGRVYEEAIRKDLVDEMYITKIDAQFEADTFFQGFDENEWSKEVVQEIPATETSPGATIYRYYKD